MTLRKRIFIVVVTLWLLIFLTSFGVVAYLTVTRPVKYMDSIEKYAGIEELDPLLILSIIKVESNFNPEATSEKNARGLMQLLPETAEAEAKKLDMGYYSEKLYEPDYSIQLGTAYFGYLVEQFNSVDLAIAAYNGGLGSVQKWLRDETISRDGKNLDNIPFQETREYVDRVKDNYRIYNMFYAGAIPPATVTDNPVFLIFRNYFVITRNVFQ